MHRAVYPDLASPDALRLFDGADGVRGHYCIGFTADGVSYFWNTERGGVWSSVGTVITTVPAAVEIVAAIHARAAPAAAMPHRRPVLAFIGHSNCGKDEACKLIAAHTPLRFAGSMSVHLAPFVAAETGQPVETYLGPERHQHAEAMFQCGERLRDANPGILVRSALEHGELLAGLRDPREVDYAREHDLVDLFVYIDRPVPPDRTMRRFGPTPWRYADVTVTNTGTLADYHARLRRLVRALGVPWRE